MGNGWKKAGDASVSWSVDGKWLAFASDRNGIYEIYILNLLTNETTQATESQLEKSVVNWAK